MDNVIRVQRAIKRVSQQEVADAIGVRSQTILAIENNKYIPSLLLGLKIALYFNIDPRELYILDEEEKNFKIKPEK